MRFHEFGNKNGKIVILIHGVLTPWQIWSEHIELLKDKYRIIVPALDAHEEECASEFISIADEARKIEDYCTAQLGGHIFALCGCSMGGCIAFHIAKSGSLTIDNLVMDGAPLVPFGKMLTNTMTNQYLTIIKGSKTRKPKTLADFEKNFLPKKHLESYLNIADNMSDGSIKNIVSSVGGNTLDSGISARILYIHGTKMSEYLSLKSVKPLKKLYPGAVIHRCKGCGHCEKAIYNALEWISILENFLENRG